LVEAAVLRRSAQLPGTAGFDAGIFDALGRLDDLGILPVADRRHRMKRLIQRWARRRRSTKMVLFRVDRPRRIDRVVAYFGEQLAPVMVAARPRRKS
jgi:hypothetical protein